MVKLGLSKKVIGTAAIGLAFAVGGAYSIQGSPVVKLQTSKLSDSTVSNTSGSNPATPSSVGTSTGLNAGSRTAKSTTLTHEDTKSSPASDSSSNPNDETVGNSATNQSETTQTPPVTAVSATLESWTPLAPYETNEQVSYQYCTYTYSDSSTQEVQVGELIYNGSDNLVGSINNFNGTCAIGNAPTPN